MSRCHIGLVAGLLLLALAARADEPVMRLVGEAQLKVLFWPVYHSQLHSEDGSYQPGQRPLRLDIRYLRSVDGIDLVTRTGEEWDALGVSRLQQQPWLERLGALWPDVGDGDVLSLTVGQDEVSYFYLNGEKLGQVDDPAFSRSFLDIWLSPNTSRPELRLALIGQAGF